MKKRNVILAVLGLCSALLTAAPVYAEENTAEETTEATGTVLEDGTYLATAMTSHYASSCLAGIDYDSLFDVTFEVQDGVFSSITLDIGTNAKSVPETAEVSMEDWPFIKLSEVQACKSLIGVSASKEAVMDAWQIENREALAEQGIDTVSGATEGSRAVRDAIVNAITMNDKGYTYAVSYYAKDAIPTQVMFEGTVTAEETLEYGQVSKTVLINDGDYVLYGVVSANDNGIDNTVIDYNYIIKVEVTVADGKISSINCSTPNGSETDQAAVAEASGLTKAALEGKDATNTAISENFPYNADTADAFTGSTEAKIVCDMINNCLKNGYTHIIGWSY